MKNNSILVHRYWTSSGKHSGITKQYGMSKNAVKTNCSVTTIRKIFAYTESNEMNSTQINAMSKKTYMKKNTKFKKILEMI